jgi:short-subunit dehydrogenase
VKALVTGASSGIGKDIAIYLSKLGYDIILVSRDRRSLDSVSKIIKTKTKILILIYQ